MDYSYARTRTRFLCRVEKRKTMQTCNMSEKPDSIENWVDDIVPSSSCHELHRKLINTTSPSLLRNQTGIFYSFRSNLKMPLSALWKTFLLYSVCAFVANAQHYGSNIDANEEGFEDLYHLSGDNMHLFAVTGHLFNRSIAEELKRLDPGLLSDEDTITVHFPTSRVPGSRWMVFREDLGLLQGIALPEHEGVTNIYVTVNRAKTPSASSLTLPCVVEVLPSEAAIEIGEKLKNHPRLKIDATHNCPHHETRTVVTVTLNAEASVLSPEKRIQCIQRLSSFFAITSQDVALHTSQETLKQHRPFLSGPGNIPKLRTHRGDRDIFTPVTLSWSLGCSSDLINDIPCLDKLETAAIDGSLAQAIGYDVAEWQIGNSVRSPKLLHRRKRASGKVPSSAGINYPPASRLSDPRMRGIKSEETVGNFQPRRKKIPANMVRATPAPLVPVRASRVIDSSLDRSSHTVPPATPRVRIPKTPFVPVNVPSSNEAPMMMFGMENIEAITGTYMELLIPQDTFFDNEDGMTRSLKLQVMDLTTGRFLGKEAEWPKFDSSSQLLYGVPGKGAPKEREYMLAAEDSGGKSSSVPFTIYVKDDKQKSMSHKFTYIFSESPENAVNDPQALFSSFGRKLSVALAKTESTPGTLAMVKVGLTKNSELYVIWFDRMYNRKTICDSDGIKKEATLMIGTDAEPGRNKPAREFAAKFKPEFKLKFIKIDLLGPCASHTTTTPLSTTTTAPTPTTTSTKVPTVVTPLLLPSTSTKISTATLSMRSSSTTTTTKKTKAPISKPDSKPSFTKPIPKLTTEVGKIKEFTIPKDVFENTKDLDDVILSLPEKAPNWLGYNAKSRAIYLMPTQDDFMSLEEHNSTHRIWKGSLSAKYKDGVDSTATQLQVYITQGMKLDEMKVNHKFHMKIKNYDITNFTASDRVRLVRLISDITGDKDGKSLYLRSLRQGSVLFSWHNSTLAYSDPCPFKDIAMLGRKFFKGNNFNPEVRTRFLQNNFTVSLANLIRSEWCTKKLEVPPPTETTNTNVNVAGFGTQGKSTTVIIIAVVVVCIVLLIVILVLKCRMGEKTNAKKKEEKDKLEREEAAIAAANPDISETPRIKKGVPIIFQDEIALEANGQAEPSPATPLMSSHRGNGDARTFAVTDREDDLREETIFNTPITRNPLTPPTPVMSGRPPPPYTKTR